MWCYFSGEIQAIELKYFYSKKNNGNNYDESKFQMLW